MGGKREEGWEGRGKEGGREERRRVGGKREGGWEGRGKEGGREEGRREEGGREERREEGRREERREEGGEEGRGKEGGKANGEEEVVRRYDKSIIYRRDTDWSAVKDSNSAHTRCEVRCLPAEASVRTNFMARGCGLP